MDKPSLRTNMQKLRDQLKIKHLEDCEKKVGGQLICLPDFIKAETVMLYSSYHNEVGTDLLLTYCLQKKKKVILPYMDSDFLLHPYFINSIEELQANSIGIREPDPKLCTEADPKEIDLVAVPGLAFDVRGARIGSGKGCYDRFLPLLRPEVPLIGLAYNFQILPQIPQEPHDLRMNFILTEKGILNY